ncbi:MAG: RlmE family RNA methyltransferase [Alphaproteobacteria bacterium]|nr:MAG: RlmE family RNA methyltransferase [Alphaproteobacteria bacterium]
MTRRKYGRARRDPKSVGRGPKVRVKSARGRSVSSTRWLQRQLNDPYVAAAREAGYRSRAAFKLIEMNEKHRFLNGARRIVDLGAAPGGWTQVAIEVCGPGAQVVGIDLLEVEAVPGTIFIQMDFLAPDAEERLFAELDGPADVVLSDMAAATTGHRQTDHLRTMALCEAALDFAKKVLRPGGHFVAKVLRGGTENALLEDLKQHFATVKHVKPPASRAESTEMYVIGLGFKGSSVDQIARTDS